MVETTQKERGYTDASDNPFISDCPVDLLVYVLKKQPGVKSAERMGDRAMLNSFKHEIIIYMKNQDKNRIIDLKKPVKKKEWLRQLKKNEIT